MLDRRKRTQQVRLTLAGQLLRHNRGGQRNNKAPELPRHSRLERHPGGGLLGCRGDSLAQDDDGQRHAGQMPRTFHRFLLSERAGLWPASLPLLWGWAITTALQQARKSVTERRTAHRRLLERRG